MQRLLEVSNGEEHGEWFYAERQKIAYGHAYAVRRVLGADYAALERELQTLDRQIVKAEEGRNDEILRLLLSRCFRIKREILKLLASRGFTEEDLELRFFCNKCHDTGLRKDKTPCDCYRPVRTLVRTRT